VESDLATHVDTITATFETTLARVVPELSEPRAFDSDRIDKLITRVVETAVGFAVGLAAGDLVRAIDRTLGSEVAARVHARIHHAPARASHAAPAFTAKTVVADLEVRLRYRLRIATGELRSLFEYALAEVPADRARTLAVALVLAHQGSLLGERLGTAIVQGWRFACAAIDGTEPPALERGSPSQALWQRWSRLAGVTEEPKLEPYIVTM